MIKFIIWLYIGLTDKNRVLERGCLSQFCIKESYRNIGIGSTLFKKSMEWLDLFKEINDVFIFVSNGNDNALEFYKGKGFKASHQILDGFITVLRNSCFKVVMRKHIARVEISTLFIF
ncbi:GNAT family N-acetyltransferase [Clostridium sp. WILCCON 0185]|uniref:GNAT family N-acetyltransferase n=1 Tax=Candidatus Clostridium stratigraminis TaxID=3381661 RepID=A0ABW8T3V8_9CLOT